MLKQIIVSKAAINFMKTTDPVVLARIQADAVDEILDSQVGDKRSETIQEVMVPWITKFCKAFCARLLEDNLKGGKK